MKKGFTLIELIVSFVLITVVSISLFKTVLTVQQRQSQNIAINKFRSFELLLNNEIEQDFQDDEIESVDECGLNCYNITFKNKGTVTISIDSDNNIITYGNIKEEIPESYKLINRMTVTKYESETNGINSYVILEIPIKSSLEPKLKSLKYMYTYDSNEGEIELTDYIDPYLSLYRRLETIDNGITALEEANLTNMQEQIDSLLDKDNSNNVFLKLYPIGSIYKSTSNTNPGSIFGGTWVSYGTGRTLVGVDTSQTEFDTVEETGGSKSNSYTPTGTVDNHTLTLDEIPSHDGHIIKSGGTYNAYINSYESKKDNLFTNYSSALGWTILSGNEIFPNSRNLGGGGSHNHSFTGTTANISTLQPYIIVYMWKRTG